LLLLRRAGRRGARVRARARLRGAPTRQAHDQRARQRDGHAGRARRRPRRHRRGIAHRLAGLEPRGRGGLSLRAHPAAGGVSARARAAARDAAAGVGAARGTRRESPGADTGAHEENGRAHPAVGRDRAELRRPGGGRRLGQRRLRDLGRARVLLRASPVSERAGGRRAARGAAGAMAGAARRAGPARERQRVLSRARCLRSPGATGAAVIGRHAALRVRESREFQAHVGDRLPRYRSWFEQAATQSGVDWRLLAAIGYQESKWDPRAESDDGAAGVMMLTAETAHSLGVKDRSNPEQSIFGGARYLAQVRAMFPERISEPDRTWLTLAAYNVGFGHLEDARVITQALGKNPDSWTDVRARLPLLAQERWYS